MKNSRLPFPPCTASPCPGSCLIPALLVVLLACAAPARVAAASVPPELCERAALRAASESGVPADVLLAITLVETGRRLDGRMRPWPWAANADGRGHWFASAEEAAGFARRQLAQGRSSFDLGCFQINWRWHGQHFDRPEALLEPLTSARYAARFLLQLHAEFGDWEEAAGAYHSRTAQHALRYRTRFAQHRAALRRDGVGALPVADTDTHGQQLPSPTAAAEPPRRQRAPVTLALMQAGAPSDDPASLVPAARAGAPYMNAPLAPPLTRNSEAGSGKGRAAGRPSPVSDDNGLGDRVAGGITMQPAPLPAFIPALAGARP